MAAALTVVAPDSLRTWYDRFSNPHDPVIFVGEDSDNRSAVVEAVLGRHIPEVRIFSSHESLTRDVGVGRLLQAAGLTVRVQTPTAARVALDKTAALGIFSALGIAVPAWGTGTPVPDLGGRRILRKRRDSTQSRGIAWLSDIDAADPDYFWQTYVEGTEYSVVYFREHGITTTFPPVWKGRTRPDLLPPWRRLRLCPPPRDALFAVNYELVDATHKIADAIEAWGFGEVEFIVDDSGEVFALEVNPRICGTMRIAAMTSRSSIFDEDAFPRGAPTVQARRYAAELPYDGAPRMKTNVIATSRITCAAESPTLVRRLVEAEAGVAGAGQMWPDRW